MRKSMTDFFKKELDLKDVSKEKRLTVLENILKYLMGLEKYIVVKKRLDDFGKGEAFLNALKNLKQHDILYVKKMRRYAIDFDESINIHKKDRRWICYFVKTFNWFIDVDDYDFLLEEDIVREMKASIVNNSTLLKKSIYYDNSVDINDLMNILFMKTIETYRIYICGCSKRFNDKQLYSCLHRGIGSKKIDIVRSYDTQINKVFKNTIPLDFLENTPIHPAALGMEV